MKKIKSLYIVALMCFIYSIVVFNQQKWKNNNIIVSDVLNYYAYLPAFFIDQDLSFSYREQIEVRSEKDHILGKEQEAGSFIPKMSMGAAVLYTPFFLLAHFFSTLLGYTTDGFSLLYSVFMVIGHLFYVFCGFFYLRKVLKLYFNERIVIYTLIIIAFCTNLYHYSTGAIGMPHTDSFLLFILFFWLTHRWHQNPSYRLSIFIGVITGLIVLIRPTNGIVAFVFIFYNVFNKETLILKKQLFLIHWKMILTICVFSLLLFSPQLIFWKLTSGSFWYYSYGEEGFYFRNPQIMKGLFSYRKGWLLYTPIMVLSIFGFYTLYKRYKPLFFPIIIFTTLNIYIIFSWWCWWYGGSFGQRSMVDSYALLALPLAAFIDQLFYKNIFTKLFLFIIIFFTGALNLVQTEQYNYCLHYDGMTKEAYWEIFFARHGFKWPEGIGYRKMIQRPDYESAVKGLKEYPNGRNSYQKEIKNQIKRIKRNKEWYNKIKNQAIEENTNLDSVLVRNARYILNS